MLSVLTIGQRILQGALHLDPHSPPRTGPLACTPWSHVATASYACRTRFRCSPVDTHPRTPLLAPEHFLLCVIARWVNPRAPGQSTVFGHRSHVIPTTPTSRS